LGFGFLVLGFESKIPDLKTPILVPLCPSNTVQEIGLQTILFERLIAKQALFVPLSRRIQNPKPHTQKLRRGRRRAPHPSGARNA
jgi:hypothetical protein